MYVYTEKTQQIKISLLYILKLKIGLVKWVMCIYVYWKKVRRVFESKIRVASSEVWSLALTTEESAA